MKRVYIVAGAESSGNRLLTQILVAAGCISLDPSGALPIDEDPCVVLRSYPHGNEWPDLAEIFRILRDRGYLVRVLVTIRDAHCVIESQLARQHHPRTLSAPNIQRAHLAIFQQLAEVNCWFTVVPYESLVLHPAGAAQGLLERIELSAEVFDNFPLIEDMNAKYYHP